MSFDIGINIWIQNNLRNVVFDWLFYGITHLGDKFVFMGIVAVLYWTYNKKFAYKFLFAYLGSAVANSVFKVIVKRPRPYAVGAELEVVDGKINVVKEGEVKSLFTNTDGYSFPSGHSQSTGVIFYSLDSEFKKYGSWVKYVLIAVLILVPFSRIYLGQHYLSDVVVGAILGIVAAYFMFKLFDKMGDKEHLYPLYAIPLIIILLAVILITNGDYGSYKDLFVAGGGYIGFTVGYFIEKHYVKHNVKAKLSTKVLKVLIGVIGVAILYEGLKTVFKIISPASLLLDFLRYGLIAIYAALGAPALFKIIFKEEATKEEN